MIRLLGIPYDASSSFMRGSAEAPAAIREAMHSPSANLWTETGLDLGALRCQDEVSEASTSAWSVTGDVDLGAAAWSGDPDSCTARWVDDGDVEFPAPGGTPRVEGNEAVRSEERQSITRRVSSVLESGDRVLSLGGDHSVTYPVMAAYAGAYPNLTLVQFDAHPDLYQDYEGDAWSHACPFARIMESGLAAQLIQVGVRTMTGHQAAQRDRFRVTTLEMRDGPLRIPRIVGPVYVSVDLDVLDPAFAPGVSHHEPGGLSTRALLDLILSIEAPVVGADVVELNPRRDRDGATAMVAARLARELLGKMLRVAR
jgi:arginase